MRRNRILCAVLAAFMVTGTAGCSNSSTTTTTTAAQSSAAETTVMAETTVVADTTQAETTAEDKTSQAETTENATEEQKEYSDEMRDISAMEFVADMKIGWNLGNTLDSSNTGKDISESPDRFETAWGAQYTSQMQMDYILESGINVIRIPVSWGEHIHDDANHTIEASWMDRVQEIVDYAYKKGAYVILNTHHEEWYTTYEEDKERSSEIIKAVWTQIGERFKDYGDHLIFEGLNEPRKKNTGVEWTGDKEAREVINEYEQLFVDTIRAQGGNNAKRFLMITGYAASSSLENLKAIKLPSDDRLIVSVHAYIPYNFALNTKGTDKWNNDTSEIDNLMKNINDLFISKGVPVIIGEFGAMNKENDEDRIAWVSYYVSAARKIGVTCCWWDNHSFRGDGEKFGLLSCNGMNIKWKYPELVEAMIASAQ